MKKKIAYLLAVVLTFTSLAEPISVPAADTSSEISGSESVSAPSEDADDYVQPENAATPAPSEDVSNSEDIDAETSEEGFADEGGTGSDAQDEAYEDGYEDGYEEGSEDEAEDTDPEAETEDSEESEDPDEAEADPGAADTGDSQDEDLAPEAELPAATVKKEAKNAAAPTSMRVEPSEINGLPAGIDVFISNTTSSGYNSNKTYTHTCLLCLPGNVDPSTIFLTWDDGMACTVGTASYQSGECPVPAPGQTLTYAFSGSNPKRNYVITTYQGSESVCPVFIDIDETQGTIAAMDADDSHETTCTGTIYIDGQMYTIDKMKGRGNATWEFADDKKPYNITLGTKINFPGVSSEKTKKWSFLAEVTDHSLLSNRTAYYLAEQMGIGQSTTSADVWMNGEYQGCYTVTPKTDSFVSKDGFMIEQDNYQEPSIEEGGDPQFELTELKTTVSGWSSAYNLITVKKIGDNLLTGDTPADIRAAAAEIEAWLEDAWEAIRSNTGYNSKGRYYTDYIDIESFTRMYLMHEYAKSYDVCAGSILFHRDGTTEDDKLIAGPAWDFDNAMGSTCQNGSLGKADNRSDGDRRRGDGKFIPLVTEYKTSIYKTISKHADFMEEVYHQYNKYRDAFDSLPEDVQRMTDEIADSAGMNHRKVKDITTNQYANTHKYSSAQTFASRTQYEQKYQATTSSATDWAVYAANLKIYVTTRSLWFANTYYDPDDPANCDHEYQAVVTPPTCKKEGFTTYTCTKCQDSYTADPTPVIPHDYQGGTCALCGEQLRTAIIFCPAGASVTVLETQNPDGPTVENASTAHPRSTDTGFIDCSGDGQINFVVNPEDGYELVSVTAEPASAYKNLKGPEDTNIPNGYRLTKVKGDLTINVVTKPTGSEEVEVPFSHSCSLSNNLTVNYYAPASVLEDYGEYRLVVWKQEFAEDGSFSAWKECASTVFSDKTVSGDAYKVFPITNVAAREMGSEIRAVLYMEKDGVICQSTEDVYSVSQYAQNQLNSTQDASLKQLLVDMLNYGAAAQAYFNYSTDR
ncbi:MAG: CotH kinase family protein, partial [Lachnospiraceae bacterium]|nr:CotH kinase family protein [Lachnospiraceae bacterium]